MEKLYEGYFPIETDYKTTFKEEVDKLIAQELTVEFKNTLIQGLTDAYINQTDELPDEHELTRLGTWLVNDPTNNPHKVALEEYPVLSEGQFKFRQRRELVSDRLDKKSDSSKHRINGKRKPNTFKVFGEFE